MCRFPQMRKLVLDLLQVIAAADGSDHAYHVNDYPDTTTELQVALMTDTMTEFFRDIWWYLCWTFEMPHHFYAAIDMIFVLVILHRFNINFFTILLVHFLLCFIDVFTENIVSILFVRDVLSAQDQWIFNFCFSGLKRLKIELLHQKESIKNLINTDITM